MRSPRGKRERELLSLLWSANCYMTVLLLENITCGGQERSAHTVLLPILYIVLCTICHRSQHQCPPNWAPRRGEGSPALHSSVSQRRRRLHERLQVSGWPTHDTKRHTSSPVALEIEKVAFTFTSCLHLHCSTLNSTNLTFLKV